MNPTFEDGDVIVSTRSYLHDIERGDVVIICNHSKDDILVIKRVIALPGDLLEVKDNVVYINGEEIVADYDFIGKTEDITWQLMENQYFVMGDNREHSKDSRYYGPFELTDIKAVGIFIHIPHLS